MGSLLLEVSSATMLSKLVLALLAVNYCAASKTCPDGYFGNEVNEKCFKLVDSVQLSWSEARDYCQHVGSALVIIRSQEEQDVLVSSLNADMDDIWIGAESETGRHGWKG